MDSEFKLSPEKIREGVDHLKEWISRELHLPNVDDEKWLETFFYNNKYSLEKTKFKLENYYTLRTKYSHILQNRDPTTPEMLQAGKAFISASPAEPMKNGSRILYQRYHPDPEIFNMDDFSKRLFMVHDLLLKEGGKSNIFVTVIDCEGFKFQHLLKMTMGMKPVSEIFNACYTERFKSIHFVNCPSMIDKLTALVKTYLSAKLGDRIYAHAAGKDLTEFIDEDLLCSDYGGKGPSLAELAGSILLKQLESKLKSL